MRHFTVIIAVLFALHSHAQTCNPDGNVVVFANYDGGIININCDVDIPNLKIGVITYEWTQINITGPFADNVTAVTYAGFNAQNNHCGLGNQPTSVNGVPQNLVNILFAPPATQSDPNGNNSMICAYSCGTGSQGGCNTSNQVANYFTTVLGGVLHSYVTQYACWGGATFNISDNTCCGVSNPTPQVTADFSVNDALICVGQCVDFTSETTGNPDTFSWSFEGAQTPNSPNENPTICYLTPGTFQVTFTASSAGSPATATGEITVISCGIPGCTYADALNYNASATIDDQSCEFDCDTANTCPGDLNYDGVVNSSDLAVFLSAYGTFCE